MPIFGFPAPAFVIEGDPEAVRDTGRAYGRPDPGGRDPPHLEVAHGAFASLAGASDDDGGLQDAWDDQLAAVAGLFSDGIGWLGEIPAGEMIGAGVILWGAGDTLDTTVDWAEGGISACGDGGGAVV
jgi:hypothetical protein